VRSFPRLRQAARFSLSIVLVATLVPLVPLAAAGIAAADGPSVPLPSEPSVPVTAPTMDPRPVDQATGAALDGNQAPGQAAPPGGGTNAATSLSPSATWNVSEHTGDFTWSYPLRVPPAPGGFEPELALSYRSSAVDGHTSATNNQASWVGDGWDLSAGFVERTYGACAEDTGGGTTPPRTGDLCWRSDNATSVFGGGGGMLIRDDETGEWRTKDDNGAKIERLTNAANGDDNGEHWRITTVDGTQYLFGSQPGSGSTWTVPVFGDDVNDPCHDVAGFGSSHCVQAYRWNLDKVIDRHGNVIRYVYDVESNNYGMNMADTAVPYIRGGTLRRVDYGLRDDLPNQQPTGRVEFTTANRCVKSSACVLDRPENWPDTPLKERCTANTCPDKHTPTFWSTQRLSTITTKVWNGTTHTDVGRWSLGQEFPDPGDGEKAALWLRSITHTGLVGTPITLPAVTFEGRKMANRVYRPDGAGPLNRYRITGIVSETGGVTSVNYEQPQCREGGPMPTSPETNTLRCFPARWVKENWAERTDYFHKYVVAQVVQSDRMSTSIERVTSYEYLDGAGWHWDTSEFVPEDKKTWDEFRGFGRVKVRSGSPNDPAGPVSLVEKRFFRGMDGDRLPSGTRPQVNVEDSIGGSYRDRDWLSGFGFETTVFNGVGGAVVGRTITEPWWRGPTATRGPFKAYLVRSGVERGYTPLAAGDERTTRVETDYDDRGLVTEVNDLGGAGAADDRCTRTSYAHNATRWLMSFPATTETVSVHCRGTAQFPAQAISATRTSYDGQAAGIAPTTGNVTRVEVADQRPASGPVYSVVATSTYDRHGRIRTATDAMSRTTTTDYTPTVGGPLTLTKVTTPPTLAVPAGFVTTTTVEPAYGQPTKVVDPNNRPTETTYDALGRKTEMWLVNHRREVNPNGTFKFSYLIRNNAPSVVTTRTISTNGGNNYATTNELFDGLLRQRQEQTVAVGGGRLLTDTRYDSQGRAYKTTQPFFNNARVDTTLWVASDVDIPGLTRTEFDGAGRVVEEVYQGGAVEKWRTTTRHGGDRVHVTPPAGGTPTTTITDARGRTTELRQYGAATPTGGYDSTRYTYTPAGQLETVTDPGNNVWRYGYDLRGRQTSAQDPDKGASTYRYDNANRLSSVTDARGVSVAYAYDALGRRTAVHEGSVQGTKLAEWLYDTAFFGKGYLASSTRWANGHPYTITIDGYAGLYQADMVIVSIPPVEGALAGNYTWEGSFDVDGSLSGEAYPAAGGLGTETVNYVLDDQGRPLSSSGAYDGTVELVTDTSYTSYGETQRIALGEGLRSWLSYYYDDHTRRLKRMVVDAEVPNPMQADLHYTYDPAGNLTSIADTPAGLPHDTQCYRYDRLRRLTEAWTPTGDCAADPSGAALGGVAPYWHSYGYDKTGNRVSEVQHASASAEVTRTYAYTGHRLNSVTTAGAGGTRLDEYGYDAVGNTTSRVLAGQGETLNWDAEGHLAWVNKNAQSTSFVYDADGQRLIRRDPTGATLYLGKQEVQWTRSTNTTRATRYYTNGGDGPTIAIRQGATLSWLANDHHGTGELTVNSATMQVNRRRHAPFGAPRGAPSAVWPGQQGFLGGVQDPSTGLTHLGAREYDPTLGRFISVDPLMDLADPQHLNGYTYSNNNPTTYSDPSGLCPDDGTGNCVDDWTLPGGSGSANKPKPKGKWQAPPDYPDWVPEDFVVAPNKATKKHNIQELLRTTDQRSVQRQELLVAYCQEFASEDPICDPVSLGDLAHGGLDGCGFIFDACDGLNSLLYLAEGDWGNAALSGAAMVPGAGIAVTGAKSAKKVDGGASVGRTCKRNSSFVPGTEVLMADGTTKHIETIRPGDLVLATDPETGETSSRRVTATITSHGRKDLVELTIDTDGVAGNQTSTIITTTNHPFWVDEERRWINAGDLKERDDLRSEDTAHAEVFGVQRRTRRQTVYNLTVDNVHTYYVQAQPGASVLVHNDECEMPFGGGGNRPPKANSYRPTDAGSYKSRDDAWTAAVADRKNYRYASTRPECKASRCHVHLDIYNNGGELLETRHYAYPKPPRKK
jgi:RHS repeat-associated protein